MEKVNARTQALTRPMAWGEMPAFTAQNAQKKGNVIRMMWVTISFSSNAFFSGLFIKIKDSIKVKRQIDHRRISLSTQSH